MEHKQMTYELFKRLFRAGNEAGAKGEVTMHIVFDEGSFPEPLPKESRTYAVSSRCEAFMPGEGSAIPGRRLDDPDGRSVRLDQLMADEGNPGGWRIEETYVREFMPDAYQVFFIPRAEHQNDMIRYCFGDTDVLARKTRQNGRIRLEPISGARLDGGARIGLPADRVYGYCTMLERHLNEPEAG